MCPKGFELSIHPHKVSFLMEGLRVLVWTLGARRYMGSHSL